jgi:ferredoxin
MIHLKIDHTEINVPEGTTVLEAAKTVGISIPSMCFMEGFENCPSCMVCLVKDRKSGNLMSSCALKVTEGMDLISNEPDVTEARKEALELLLSDHVGDCEAPCSLACPAGMNIPLMNRFIASRQFTRSLDVVKEDIALPFILGYICPAPCEKACRRKQVDEAVSVCLLKRFVASEEKKERQLTIKRPNKCKKIAIIGTGPAGLASAFYLLKLGYSCVLFDKNEEAGGALRYRILENELPRSVIDTEVSLIRELGAEFKMNILVDPQMFEKEIKPNFDAMIIATGDIATDNYLSQLLFAKNGIVADDGTFATPEPGIFACGSVIRSQKMAVRAVAQGKAAAISVDCYLRGLKLEKPLKKFNSRFDKLQVLEFAEYLKESVPDLRLSPASAYPQGYTSDEAVKEASRCLHCDCRKPNTCKLRIYADEYKADRKKYLIGERRIMTKQFQNDHVVYEPEKCIRCGLCVEITSQSKEMIGLSYVGRGFDVRIEVPFGKTIQEGLTHAAKKCVEACPTGALAFKK